MSQTPAKYLGHFKPCLKSGADNHDVVQKGCTKVGAGNALRHFKWTSLKGMAGYPGSYLRQLKSWSEMQQDTMVQYKRASPNGSRNYIGTVQIVLSCFACFTVMLDQSALIFNSAQISESCPNFYPSCKPRPNQISLKPPQCLLMTGKSFVLQGKNQEI